MSAWIDADERRRDLVRAGRAMATLDGRGGPVKGRRVVIGPSEPPPPAVSPSTDLAHLLEGEWDSAVPGMETRSA